MSREEMLVAAGALVDQARTLARRHEREKHGGRPCLKTRTDIVVHILNELMDDLLEPMPEGEAHEP